MPFIAYVHAPPPDEPENSAWQPDWKVWRPTLAAVTAGVSAGQVEGAATLVLVIAAFGLGCRALDAALPYKQGLREWRQ